MQPNDHATRIERALLALEGLSVGDGFGEMFFTKPEIIQTRIAHREPPPPPWMVTDDTMMAVSIVRCLMEYGEINQDGLAKHFADEYARDPMRGYGGTAHRILQSIGQGVPWKDAAGRAFDGQGSCGNGGAMRAAPVGAYFADDYERVAVEARKSAQVTHAHPDGQTGAMAVAIAAAWVVQHSKAEQRDGTKLISTVLEHLPHTLTYFKLRKALEIPLNASPLTAASFLGNGSEVVASDTVPFCLWCAARHLGDYKEALWTTVSGLGDRDTTCAIVGGIVALSVGREGILADWLQAREQLAV